MSSPSSDTDYDITAGWRAVIALVVGFFMILLDTTIVTVAMPRIMSGLGASTSDVVWVTSAYLLAFAVPLLITGRLGDRFGPRRIYLIGITVFTLASALCGFAGSIAALIAGRVAQGVGASMISPQSMSVITRMFPPTRRGAVMGMWGAVGGVAALSGPMLGGFILQMASWEWIFRINLPIGALAFVGAWKLVPRLPTHGHRFDLLGVALSAVGMFCLVFGLEEGSRYRWGQIAGPISIPLLLAAGAMVMALFVWWQSRAPEPLVPLSLFRDRDFTAANIGVMCMGGIATAMNIPLFLHLQTGRGIDPFLAAVLVLPSGLLGAVLAPFTGRHVDRTHPRHVAIIGFILLFASLAATAWTMLVLAPTWWFLITSAGVGAANSLIWGPLSVSATRNLPRERAGAGSGVYNTTRQMGAVLVTAATATLMTSRLMARPEHEYPQAMADTMWLQAAVALIGVGVAVALRRRESQ